MEEQARFRKLVWCQSAGFIVIAGLSWVDECLNLRGLILGNHPYISDFRESTLEMLMIFMVWLLVVGSTRRMMSRVSHLENFLRICAWCRRIGSKGGWIQLEEFMDAKYHVRTSHGICEDCLHKQEASIHAEKHQPLLPLDAAAAEREEAKLKTEAR
jgi:hypothetical protein